MLPDFVRRDADLGTSNTLALPARAELFARIESTQQLAAVATSKSLAGLPRFILGGGANVVLGDTLPGLVLQIAQAGREFLGDDADAHYIAAAAGENWHDFVCWTLAAGFSGLENLALIPGTVGAAPIQNIGAYGIEVGALVDHLEAIDLHDGSQRRFAAADCGFAYRDSIFKRQGWHLEGRYAITRVVFRLPKAWQAQRDYGEVNSELARRGWETPTPQQMAEAICAIRRRKLPDPAQTPNAGSFFQNPLVNGEEAAHLLALHPQMPCQIHGDGRCKLAAGWLIEQAGWKGRALGPVSMYAQQALVLVNSGGASAHDVVALSDAVRAEVRRIFAVDLQPEPVFVGARPAI
jgi:UDP-N-acetylmuramate dehydrogenase